MMKMAFARFRRIEASWMVFDGCLLCRLGKKTKIKGKELLTLILQKILLELLEDEYFEVDKSKTKHDGYFVNRGMLEKVYVLSAFLSFSFHHTQIGLSF
ncbi:Ubinuclein-2 [Bienertia sinuspersici]